MTGYSCIVMDCKLCLLISCPLIINYEYATLSLIYFGFIEKVMCACLDCGHWKARASLLHFSLIKRLSSSSPW